MLQLPEMVQALLDPGIYPEATRGVELVQTQMSFVFLTDGYVYKVKKPVDLGFLDYTTLDRRQFYCQQEVTLNRRLCPEAYLGVVAVTENEDTFALDSQGEVIDYAVKMRRLPQEAMMNVLLEQQRALPPMVISVARKLVDFHQNAETSDEIGTYGSLEMITRNAEENFTQTKKYIDNTIFYDWYQHIKTYTNNFINQNVALLEKRVAEGRIRDCHGDLHAAHICFTDGICIYDCIEFNDRFRYCDVASEIAFLAMDLDNYGRVDLSQNFVNAYVDKSQDSDLLKLIDFYKCYRAYVRGKVESFQLDDPHIAKEAKKRIKTRARNYFELAKSYV